ncbi:MAG TPA: SIMPL domain-containing protein [Gemmatimonadales bacterium]|nr:SIMPL domain-containing protein [Gemmatimonadales bacterium]
MRNQLFWGLTALAVALVIGAFAGASAIRDFRRVDEMEATGSSRRAVTADYIVWRANVSVQGSSRQTGYAQLTSAVSQVRSYLEGKGLPDSSITVTAVEVYPVQEYTDMGRETGRILGYRLSQNFEIRSADVDGIAALAQQSAELIAEGVPMVSYSPEYIFTGIDAIRTELLAEATSDAAERARAIAESAGAKIGAARSARMGVFQITPRHSTMVSDYGVNDTSSKEKDVTAVVRVTFAVE